MLISGLYEFHQCFRIKDFFGCFILSLDQIWDCCSLFLVETELLLS